MLRCCVGADKFVGVNAEAWMWINRLSSQEQLDRVVQTVRAHAHSTRTMARRVLKTVSSEMRTAVLFHLRQLRVAASEVGARKT
jgi:hypothetical protein